MLIEEVRVGARIKCGILTQWLGLPTRKPITWFKGTIIEVNNRNNYHSIVINIWNKKYNLRIKRLMCFPKNGEYKKIVLL